MLWIKQQKTEYVSDVAACQDNRLCRKFTEKSGYNKWVTKGSIKDNYMVSEAIIKLVERSQIVRLTESGVCPSPSSQIYTLENFTKPQCKV